MNNKIPSQLSDSELVAAVAQLTVSERRSTVALVEHLAEMETRKLHLAAGFPSLFVYCVQVLRHSEGGAYNRIEAARAARRFPSVLALLERGALNLATVRRLAPHLTPENHETLLAAASYKSKREVEELVARASPRPDVASSVRKLPDRKVSVPTSPTLDVPAASSGTAGDVGSAGDVDRGGVDRSDGCEASTPGDGSAGFDHTMDAAAAVVRAGPLSQAPRHPLVTALSPGRYQIRFTASASTCEKLRLAQDLLRHAVPNGDPAEIFDRALTALLDELGKRRFAATQQPRGSREVGAGSRRSPAVGAGSYIAPVGARPRTIPAVVKRSVADRDEGRCAFVASNGRRCGERGFLEFHHVIPYARGGPATEANIQLRCRAHNGCEADMDFGRWNGPRGQGTREQLVPGRVGLAERKDHPPEVLARGALDRDT
jgi:hypothetical protein